MATKKTKNRATGRGSRPNARWVPASMLGKAAQSLAVRPTAVEQARTVPPARAISDTRTLIDENAVQAEASRNRLSLLLDGVMGNGPESPSNPQADPQGVNSKLAYVLDAQRDVAVIIGKLGEYLGFSV
jgi:hypothetical protein